MLVGGHRATVVGTVSMDVIAVRVPTRLEEGTPVTLLGDGVLAEHHAHVAETIAYELLCGLDTSAPRAQRVVTGG